MELCSNQIIVKQIKIYFVFQILESSHTLPWWQLCTLWHSLHQLQEVCFTNSLEGVPTYAEHLLAAFSSLSDPTYPKPFQLGWSQVIVEARSSDAALHHSLSWSNNPYTAWRCVLDHWPVEKQMIVPLRVNQMGWLIAAECCVPMMVKCALNSK